MPEAASEWLTEYPNILTGRQSHLVRYDVILFLSFINPAQTSKPHEIPS
jgi:hypothetical protein